MWWTACLCGVVLISLAILMRGILRRRTMKNNPGMRDHIRHLMQRSEEDGSR